MKMGIQLQSTQNSFCWKCMLNQMFVFAPVGIDKRLEDFDYSDMDMANLFHTIMNTTAFEGVSVSVFNN